MSDYWTDEEKELLEKVASLEETADVAVSILKRMRGEGKPVVQICGPMSTGGAGSFEENMARFQKAIERASENGLTVFNQIPFQTAIIRLTDYYEGSPYNTDILEVFYRRVFECGYISKALFLSDWQSSRGAVWERNLVSDLGIEIEEYPEEWLND